MRFLSFILLFSLPCTISIKAMKCGIENTKESVTDYKIIEYTESDYNKKISIIEAFMYRSFYAK